MAEQRRLRREVGPRTCKLVPSHALSLRVVAAARLFYHGQGRVRARACARARAPVGKEFSDVTCTNQSCGIFAYVNHGVPRKQRYIVDALLTGLRRLEYRGLKGDQVRRSKKL